LPIEFYAAVEGYYEKQTDLAKVIRFASYRISEAMAGTKAVGSLEKFWPMEGDKKQKKIEPMTKDKYDAIIKRHNIKQK